jgi:hypothetical protein
MTHTELIEHVLTARPPAPHQPAATFHLYSYMAGHRPRAAAPDDKIVSQFLAVASWQQLKLLLHELDKEHAKPSYSYAWFISVAMQRIHGVSPQALKTARRQLSIVRRGGV